MKISRVQVDKLFFAMAMLGFAFFAASSYGDCVNEANQSDPVIKAFTTANHQSLFGQEGSWIIKPGMVVTFKASEQNHTVASIQSISDQFIQNVPRPQAMLLKGLQTKLQSHPFNVPVDFCSDNNQLSIKIMGSTLSVVPNAQGFDLAGKLMGVDLQTSLVRTSDAGAVQ